MRRGHTIIIHMKTSIISVALALSLLTIFPAHAQQTERLKERAADAAEAVKNTAKKAAGAVAQTTREAWGKTKAFLSDDPDHYRRGLEQKLNELSADIAVLRKHTAGLKGRSYFLARVEALEQHYKYANDQVVTLLPEQIRKGREGQRKTLDSTIERLEDHVALTQREARDFTSHP